MIKRKLSELQNRQRFWDRWWSTRQSRGLRREGGREARCRSFSASLRDARWRSSCRLETHLCIERPRPRCSLARRCPGDSRHRSRPTLPRPRTCRTSAVPPTSRMLQTASSCRKLRAKLLWHLFALKRSFCRPEKCKTHVERRLSTQLMTSEHSLRCFSIRAPHKMHLERFSTRRQLVAQSESYQKARCRSTNEKSFIVNKMWLKGRKRKFYIKL